MGGALPRSLAPSPGDWGHLSPTAGLSLPPLRKPCPLRCPRAFRAGEPGGPLEPPPNFDDPQAPTLRPMLTLPHALISALRGAHRPGQQLGPAGLLGPNPTLGHLCRGPSPGAWRPTVGNWGHPSPTVGLSLHPAGNYHFVAKQSIQGKRIRAPPRSPFW